MPTVNRRFFLTLSRSLRILILVPARGEFFLTFLPSLHVHTSAFFHPSLRRRADESMRPAGIRQKEGKSRYVPFK